MEVELDELEMSLSGTADFVVIWLGGSDGMVLCAGERPEAFNRLSNGFANHSQTPISIHNTPRALFFLEIFVSPTFSLAL